MNEKEGKRWRWRKRRKRNVSLKKGGAQLDCELMRQIVFIDWVREKTGSKTYIMIDLQSLTDFNRMTFLCEGEQICRQRQKK